MKEQNPSIIPIPYLKFNDKYWKVLDDSFSLDLITDKITDKEVIQLKRTNDEISIDEINKIYLPISRLLNFYISLNLRKKRILEEFLGKNNSKIPYVIGIAGSVAVGKSTTARLLQTLLSRWPNHRKVGLITTDGFLYSNQFLKEHGLIRKKGFPQSYDIHRLVKFISDVKSGMNRITAPLYSHFMYDIIPNKKQVIEEPDILILEGLNVLQGTLDCQNSLPHFFISDFIDFSIYVDAPESLLKKWYVSRFLKFYHTTFCDSKPYFYHFSKLEKEKAIKIAEKIWEEINKINLEENIIPTKEKANLIMTKGSNHSIINIRLRK